MEPATCRVVAQCFNQLRHSPPQNLMAYVVIVWVEISCFLKTFSEDDTQVAKHDVVLVCCQQIISVLALYRGGLLVRC